MNCKIHFAILLILALLLSGCAKKDPVATVIDNNIDHINDVLDYSYNNFDQTKEIKFLENELEHCIISLDSVKQTYSSKIESCEANTRYWRLATTGLGILLLLGIFAKIKRII
jgi:PBP1b-binding outer membrane lipoprotein LpoB